MIGKDADKEHGQIMELVTPAKKTVAVCETQPLTVNGLYHLLETTDDLKLGSSHDSPAEWMLSPEAERSDVLIIDKGLGAKVVMDTLHQVRSDDTQPGAHFPAVVIWGMSITEAEALRFLQVGAKGIVR